MGANLEKPRSLDGHPGPRITSGQPHSSLYKVAEVRGIKHLQTEGAPQEVSPPNGRSLAGFLWLALASIVVPSLLGLWLNDCLRGRFMSRVFTHTPVASSPVPGAANPAVVETPYGVVCDYLPDAWQALLGNLAMAAIFFALGLLAARWVRVRPLLAAVGLGCIGMSAQLALTLFAYPDSLRFDVKATDELGAEFVRSIRVEAIKMWLISCVIASVICALGVGYALWRQRRAAGQVKAS